MTGYGRGEAVAEGLRLTAELRSVNHRFCELSARLPRSLAAYEAEARKIVQEKMTRGKLSLVETTQLGTRRLALFSQIGPCRGHAQHAERAIDAPVVA